MTRSACGTRRTRQTRQRPSNRVLSRIRRRCSRWRHQGLVEPVEEERKRRARAWLPLRPLRRSLTWAVARGRTEVGDSTRTCAAAPPAPAALGRLGRGRRRVGRDRSGLPSPALTTVGGPLRGPTLVPAPLRLLPPHGLKRSPCGRRRIVARRRRGTTSLWPEVPLPAPPVPVVVPLLRLLLGLFVRNRATAALRVVAEAKQRRRHPTFVWLEAMFARENPAGLRLAAHENVFASLDRHLAVVP
mmetsp:Transcript_73483/g.204157  ORF Transcript_73483/g.204157 Transcript_73483/m.204157 type:complete len:244 (+) Transcript_73483:50-781(+)